MPALSMDVVVATNAAFFGVFGAFVVAFVVLAVVTVRWAVRRDRAGRAEWVRQHREKERRAAPPVGPHQTNGHVPNRRRRGTDPRSRG